MPVPDEHVCRAALDKSRNGGVNLAGKKLPHFRVFRIRLLLAADSAHPLRVRDHKHRFRLPGNRESRRNRNEEKSHS